MFFLCSHRRCFLVHVFACNHRRVFSSCCCYCRHGPCLLFQAIGAAFWYLSLLLQAWSLLAVCSHSRLYIYIYMSLLLQAWSLLVICSHRRCLDVFFVQPSSLLFGTCICLQPSSLFFLVAVVIAGMALACYFKP